MTLWIKKYQPKKLMEVEAHKGVLNKLKEGVLNKKTILLHGPTGCGKTCSVYALANELNYEIIEINASDLRNKEQIKNIVGGAVKQKSLFYNEKIVLVDEIDGLDKSDFGGVAALAEIIKNYPVILTANDPWDSKLTPIRNKSEMIEFKKLDYLAIYGVLKKISEKENIRVSENLLINLSKKVKGDLRAAIVDLQSLVCNNKVLDLGLLDEREKKESIFNSLKLIFKSKKAEEVLESLNDTELNLDECFLWLDENIPREYKKDSLVNAYEAMSKADIFNGRIKRWQYWRFLVYRNILMTAGVALAKKEINNNFVNYKRASRILKLWIAKQKSLKKKAIAEKIAKNIHSSIKRILKDFSYFGFILVKDKEIVENIGLNEEEIDWLKKEYL